MAQTSNKRRNIFIAVIIIVVFAVAIIAGTLVFYEFHNVNNSHSPSPAPSSIPTITPTQTPTNIPITVSGEAYVSGALSLPPTTIQAIEFTDTQTGAVTTFHFHFSSPGDNRAGDYSVTLKNEHTYNVTISYYFDGDLINSDATYITTFTVKATAGQTAITKNFI